MGELLDVIRETMEVWARHSCRGLLGIQVDDAAFERLRDEVTQRAVVPMKTARLGRCIQVNSPYGSVLVFAPFVE